VSVYFIREGGFIKIGYSNDVRSRVAAIINGLRGQGELLGAMPGGRDVEKHLHRVFAVDREYGEWFRVTDKLLAFIETTCVAELPAEERKPSDRLQLQEERYAEEAAYFIRTALEGIALHNDTFTALERSTSIPAERLKLIYDGAICPITAGEYVVLRMMHDASLGMTPDDYKDAEAEGRRWAEERIARKRAAEDAAND
jgi:hypothetical protein